MSIEKKCESRVQTLGTVGFDGALPFVGWCIALAATLFLAHMAGLIGCAATDAPDNGSVSELAGTPESDQLPTNTNDEPIGPPNLTPDDPALDEDTDHTGDGATDAPTDNTNDGSTDTANPIPDNAGGPDEELVAVDPCAGFPGYDGIWYNLDTILPLEVTREASGAECCANFEGEGASFQTTICGTEPPLQLYDPASDTMVEAEIVEDGQLVQRVFVYGQLNGESFFYR